jgi:ribonuclease J
LTEINKGIRDLRRSSKPDGVKQNAKQGNKPKTAGKTAHGSKQAVIGINLNSQGNQKNKRSDESKYKQVSQTVDSAQGAGIGRKKTQSGRPENSSGRRNNSPGLGSGKKKSNANNTNNKSTLRIIPLGGLNEIGKNITAFEYQDSILLVDCGMSFPNDELLGIDVVIPDFTYLEENKKKIKALFVTHGHEDHIGGIPYLLKKLSVPIYASKLTLGLIESKVKEHGINAQLRPIMAGQTLKIGPFSIECIRVTHSIADSLCFAITTPVGVIFHTGDFKVDYTPVDGEPIDFQKIAAIGKKGVLLMLSDSTNAIRQGYTQSEQHLEEVMEHIFDENESRIIVATFASNVHRIQTIINTAVRHKRKVTLSGRSMLKVLDIAIDLGYIKMPKDMLVDIGDIKGIPDKKLVVITTGSQGEPMSALTRMASGDHRQVAIKKGDTIILSSSPIPGNEKTVSNTVNRLLEKDANVIYSDIADIHVSGHGCSEELKLMLRLVKPKYFMPVHGEYRHLHEHFKIANSLGYAEKDIYVLENGHVLETDGNYMKYLSETVPAEPVFVDGLGVGDIRAVVLRDRKTMSESGLIMVTATLDKRNGKLIFGPEIISRGFIYVKENEDLMTELQKTAESKFIQLQKDGKYDEIFVKNAVTNELKNFIYRKTKRNPLILTILGEA